MHISAHHPRRPSIPPPALCTVSHDFLFIVGPDSHAFPCNLVVDCSRTCYWQLGNFYIPTWSCRLGEGAVALGCADYDGSFGVVPTGVPVQYFSCEQTCAECLEWQGPTRSEKFGSDSERSSYEGREQ
ncbi:uncharacterized protein [Physcomitrium patens]|uniref:Uncharacterized protein n=1 Tax=Physcomitrium patens TaxID=3218 RepID=A0A2K1JR45_PHYPA|nr:uncharacterized protein LOC112289317 [Physcomitrium patens]PNR44008.1 hypothetical protein PHYPA_016391 [Physcomitrium patens]|eukprot:XP_024390214.1 uncharacterized protein LOC112289317 [Physcomitrella patens]